MYRMLAIGLTVFASIALLIFTQNTHADSVASNKMELLEQAVNVVPKDKIPPLDRCFKDTGFAKFRARLRSIVAAQDVTALRNIMAPDAHFGFNYTQDIDDFFAPVDQNGEIQSIDWKYWNVILELGCIEVGESKIIPSFVALFGHERDIYETVFPLYPDVVLYETQDVNAKKLQTLNWEYLSPVYSKDYENDDWLAVKTDNGIVGFVRREEVTSYITPHLQFKKLAGEWRITRFGFVD